MNRDLQERGFECLVENHDIECVTSSEDRIHISCVVSVLEDDCIEFLLHQRKEEYAKALQPKPLWKLCST
jgi:ABC-type dipeptide/oligopeptide/nickel transport system ATPase component